MLLEVLYGKVTHDGVEYITGEVIDGLNAADEQRLVDIGACRTVEGATPKAPSKGKKGADKSSEEELPEADKSGLNLDVDPDELIKGKK